MVQKKQTADNGVGERILREADRTELSGAILKGKQKSSSKYIQCKKVLRHAHLPSLPSSIMLSKTNGCPRQVSIYVCQDHGERKNHFPP